MTLAVGGRIRAASRQEFRPAQFVPGILAGAVLGITEVIFSSSLGSLVVSGDLAPYLAFGIGIALVNLGLVLLHFHEIGRARDLLVEGLAFAQDIDAETFCQLLGFASIANKQGQPQKSARLLGAADAQRVANGRAVDPGDLADYKELMAALRAQLGEETVAAARAEGEALTLQQALALALCTD